MLGVHTVYEYTYICVHAQLYTRPAAMELLLETRARARTHTHTITRMRTHTRTHTHTHTHTHTRTHTAKELARRVKLASPLGDFTAPLKSVLGLVGIPAVAKALVAAKEFLPNLKDITGRGIEVIGAGWRRCCCCWWCCCCMVVFSRLQSGVMTHWGAAATAAAAAAGGVWR